MTDIGDFPARQLLASPQRIAAASYAASRLENEADLRPAVSLGDPASLDLFRRIGSGADLRSGSAARLPAAAGPDLKASGFNAEAKPLLDKAGVEPDEGVTDLDGLVEAAKQRYWDHEPSVRTLA